MRNELINIKHNKRKREISEKLYIRKKKKNFKKKEITVKTVTDSAPAASDGAATARVRIGLSATSTIVVRCAAT